MKKSVVIILSISMLLACTSIQEVDETYVNYFPRETDLPGWEFMIKPKAYKNTDLNELNGVYRRYNAHKGNSALYKSISDNADSPSG